MALFARSDDAAKPSSSRKPPKDPIREAIQVLFGAQLEGVVELRAIGVSRHGSHSEHVEASHYAPDEIGFDRLARDARELSPRAKGIYCTLNPVATKAAMRWAKDTDILARRWLLVDCDPLRPSDTNATDAEKAMALEKAKAIRDHLYKKAWPQPVLADSGNGYHLLYRIDLPNDGNSLELVKGVLHALAAQFSDDQVAVDTINYNASRICKLYGTMARKGEHTDERPHRTSALVEVPKSIDAVGFEWLRALVNEAPEKPSTSSAANGKAATNGHCNGNGNGTAPARRKGIWARDLGEDPVEAYGNKAVAEELNRLLGTAPGSRNHQLFKSAAALAQITASSESGLSEQDTRQLLARAAREIGLQEGEIQKTLDSAFKAGSSQPRDMSKVGTKKRRPTQQKPTVLNEQTGEPERIDDSHRLAREFLKAHFSHPDGPTLRYWSEEWYAWYDGRWRPASDREINGQIATFCKPQFAGTDEVVSTRLVGNVALALRGMVLVPSRDVTELPAWLDEGEDDPPPAECLSTLSEIIHLPTLLEQGPEAPDAIRPKTPRFFSTNVLNYSFDPNPPIPESWLQFLKDLWPDDPEAIRALQQWFGYLITSDTSQQKILLLIGPKRSGKGTITRTLRALVGEANVAAPTLSVLGSQFGCQPLIGKTVAVCPESRLTGRSDTQAIVERLLSISGEDPQSIDRKHLTAWHGTLKTRFVLLGNELPRLGDYSGALPGRMIVLKMVQSFFGREDLGLQDRILGELPGILLWAIAGWHDLRQSGRFLQPQSGQELLEELEELTNPIGAFLAECCDLGEGEVPIQDLYQAWKKWCEENGRERPGDVQGFSKSLRAAVSTIQVSRPRVEGSRIRTFTGVELRTEFRPAPPSSKGALHARAF